MRIRAAIVDDDNGSREAIYQIVDTFFQGQNIDYRICLYEGPMELLMDLDQGKYYEIYLLDVEMPVLTGIELARRIRKYYFEPAIIYITDHVQYSIEAFEVEAFRYIPKRFIVEKLPEALKILLPKLQEEEQSYYIIRHYLDMEILLYRDIYYLKKEGKYVVFYHTRGESRERETLKNVLERLPEERFLEIGRGYIVNIEHVMLLDKKVLLLRNGLTIPLSRSGITALQERMEKVWNFGK